MAQGLKLPLFSGACIKDTVGKIIVEYSHICGPGAYSSTIFLGRIWLDKDSGRFSATLQIRCRVARKNNQLTRKRLTCTNIIWSGLLSTLSMADTHFNLCLMTGHQRGFWVFLSWKLFLIYIVIQLSC